MAMSADHVRVGAFELDVRAGELLQDGARVRLQDQPLRVLLALVEHRGEVVTRDELRRRLWPSDTFVDFERSLNAAVKRLREALGDSAASPRYIETLPRHGYRLIANVELLARTPTAEGPELPVTAPEGSAASSSRCGMRGAGPIGVVAVLVLGVLVAVAAIDWWPDTTSPPSAPSLNLAPGKVVVATFVNRTGDVTLDALGLQISDWLTQCFFRMGASVAVNPELPLLGGPTLPRSVLAAESDPLRALAARTGAELVVSGAYYLEGDRVAVHSQITNIASGDLVASLDPVFGPRSAPTQIVADVARTAMGALALRQGSRYVGDMTRVLGPPAYDAYVQWERAMGIDQSAYADAEPFLRRSLELDPDFVIARFYLWHMFAAQARYVEASALIQPLEDPHTYSRLTPYERAYTRFMRAFLDGNWSVELEGIREAAQLMPTPRNFYWLASVERRARHPAAALEALARIRPDDSPAAFGPEASAFLHYRAIVHHELGQYREELDTARLAQHHYPADCASYEDEVSALIALGRVGDVEAVISRAEGTSFRSGNLGRVLYRAARELDAHGHPDEARALATRAATWYTNHVGRATPAVALRFELGYALIEALECSRGLDVWRTWTSEDPDDLIVRSDYATALVRCDGSRTEARAIAEQLALQDRPGEHGHHIFRSARVWAALGEREAAMKALKQSFSKGWGHDHYRTHLDYAWKPLRDYPPFREWLKTTE